MRLNIFLHHAAPHSFMTFVRGLVTFRKAPPAAIFDLSQLAAPAERLAALNRGTEQDFLAIGSRLMEFLGVSDQITKGMNSIVQSAAGDQGARAATELEHALRRCRILVSTTTQVRDHLAGLRREATEVAGIFGGFRQAVASFHVVCTMTRIEAARLGGEGDELSSLVDEVLALAHNMEALVKRVLDSAHAVDRQVDHIAAGLRGTDELLDRLALTIPHVLRNLEAFSAQQAAAAALSAQLARESRSIFQSIMDAVTSIQFHDITRQQVEHVAAALQHLATLHPSKAHPHHVAAALELEAMQLISAHETFDESIVRLWHDLEGIAASVRGMATHGQSLVDACGKDSAFFLEMQHCFEAIATADIAHQAAQHATRQAAQALAPTLEAMRVAAAEIRILDVQLLRVALNANVRAAHLGRRGDTLAVLASALQDLATKAQHRSEHAVSSLDAMFLSVAYLVKAPQAAQDTVSAMHDIVNALQQGSADGALGLAEATTLSTYLAGEIAAARTGFRAGDLFAEAVPLCLAEMHQAGRDVTQHADAADARDESLEGFARHYTMQSERDVHAAATDAGVEPQLVAAGDAEFGDNIELF